MVETFKAKRNKVVMSNKLGKIENSLGSVTESAVSKIKRPNPILNTSNTSKIKPGRGTINIPKMTNTPTPRIKSDCLSKSLRFIRSFQFFV